MVAELVGLISSRITLILAMMRCARVAGGWHMPTIALKGIVRVRVQ